MNDKRPCFKHRNVGYKKGCPDCFKLNHKSDQEFWDDDNGEWVHDPDMGNQ